MARRIRDHEGTRRRGRWKHVSSTQRYQKVHLLVSERRRFGEKIIRRGKKIDENPREAIIKAILKGPAAESPEGKAIVKAMMNPVMPDNVECIRPGLESPRLCQVGDADRMSPEMMQKTLCAHGVEPGGSVKEMKQQIGMLKTMPVPPQEGSLNSEDDTVKGGDTDGGQNETQEASEESDSEEDTRGGEEGEQDDERRGASQPKSLGGGAGGGRRDRRPGGGSVGKDRGSEEAEGAEEGGGEERGERRGGRGEALARGRAQNRRKRASTARANAK